MKIRLMPRVEDIRPHYIKGSNAIVIDVLRAASVIVTALKNGAVDIVPVLSPEEAFVYKQAVDNVDKVILGGERI